MITSLHHFFNSVISAIPWDMLINIFVAICYLCGSLLSLTAAIGLIRFPDTLMRMHAATKPQTLGLILIILGTAIYRGTNMADTSMLALAAVFTLITAPASGHRVGRVAYFEQYRKGQEKNPESVES